MIQVQLKLRLTKTQEREFTRWLWHLTGVYNWALRKVAADADDGIFWKSRHLTDLLAGHSQRIGIPSHVLRGTACTALNAWERCFRGLARRPRPKSRRNALNSIPFPDPFKVPTGRRIHLRGYGAIRFHAQEIPAGRIKCGRMVRRASGWYLCLFIDGDPQSIPHVGEGALGIDPGHATLLTLSTGEKIEHPRELQRTAARLAQAQRGNRKRLTARLLERTRNQRKDRNHKLSRRLVAENAVIGFSVDPLRGLARISGTSVASAAHGELRGMLAYKCRAGGRQFAEVPGRYSTVTCSACGARSGPTGYAGLKVRQWRCGCGAEHDRDVNAAINTLQAARGMRVERAGDGTPGIARMSNTAKSKAVIGSLLLSLRSHRGGQIAAAGRS